MTAVPVINMDDLAVDSSGFKQRSSLQLRIFRLNLQELQLLISRFKVTQPVARNLARTDLFPVFLQNLTPAAPLRNG